MFVPACSIGVSWSETVAGYDGVGVELAGCPWAVQMVSLSTSGRGCGGLGCLMMGMAHCMDLQSILACTVAIVRG